MAKSANHFSLLFLSFLQAHGTCSRSHYWIPSVAFFVSERGLQLNAQSDKSFGMIIKYVDARCKCIILPPCLGGRENREFLCNKNLRTSYFLCVYTHTNTCPLCSRVYVQKPICRSFTRRGEFRIVQTLSEIKCRHLVPVNSLALAKLWKFTCMHMNTRINVL